MNTSTIEAEIQLGSVADRASANSAALDAAQERPVATKADAGLLLIPGIGLHPRKSVLFDMAQPLLDRLAQEGQLLDVSATTVGEPEISGGPCDALLVEYRRVPGSPDPSDRASILIVEGRWEGVFDASPLKTVSTWSALNSPNMMWELTRYVARGSRWIFSLFALAFLIAGIVMASHAVWAVGLLATSALIMTLLVALTMHGPGPGSPGPPGWRARALSFSLVGTLVVYEIQRAFVLLVTAVGILLLPVGAVVVRWLCSLPLLDRLGLGMLQSVERTLLTGGIADMEAVASNHVASGGIHTRLRRTLEDLEGRLVPDGTLTVIGHSGGAPLAWYLLSEPPITLRAATGSVRYRLITVGAALNWALRGFRSLATPLSGALVNTDKPEAERTYWINVFSAWDPAPHGPVNPHDLKEGWSTWDPDNMLRPNRQVCNLGSPLSAEHSEYFRNQQEFVPTLMRAIDPDIEWAQIDAGKRAELLSNLRFALVSPLARLRLIVIAVPLAALANTFRGTSLICEGHAGGAYGKIVDAVGPAISTSLDKADLAFVPRAVCANAFTQGVVVFVALAVLANALMDVYTNYIWQALGRRSDAIRPARRSPLVVPFWRRVVVPPFWRVVVFPFWLAMMVWLPTVVIPALVLWPFNFGAVYWFLIGGTALLAILEVVWLNECLLAFVDQERFARYNLPLGRRAHGLQSTPAAYGTKPASPPVRVN